MSRSVLVIGAQGFLGSFIARAFAEEGWRVTRGGRRPEIAPDFRLVDLDRPETVRNACGEVDLVVSTVRRPDLVAERAVLREGGTLLNLDDLPGAERTRLKREIREPKGLVVDRSGLGGVGYLVLAELLGRHPESDTVEYGFLVSAAEAAGKAGGAFVHRLLAGPGRHPTMRMQLPDPFGRRRCIEAGPAAAELLPEVARGRTVRLYICFLPAVFNGAMLALNGLGIASRLPLAVFTVGRRSAPTAPSRQHTCHWVSVRREGEMLAARFLLGEGDYRMTVAATMVFADALVPQAGGGPSRTGVFGVEEMFALSQLQRALAARGITIREEARAVTR